MEPPFQWVDPWLTNHWLWVLGFGFYLGLQDKDAAPIGPVLRLLFLRVDGTNLMKWRYSVEVSFFL